MLLLSALAPPQQVTYRIYARSFEILGLSTFRRCAEAQHAPTGPKGAVAGPPYDPASHTLSASIELADEYDLGITRQALNTSNLAWAAERAARGQNWKEGPY